MAQEMFLKADCQICCSKKSGTVGAIGDGAENTYNVQKLTRLGEKVHSSLKLCLCLILLASAPLRSQLDRSFSLAHQLHHYHLPHQVNVPFPCTHNKRDNVTNVLVPLLSSPHIPFSHQPISTGNLHTPFHRNSTCQGHK